MSRQIIDVPHGISSSSGCDVQQKPQVRLTGCDPKRAAYASLGADTAGARIRRAGLRLRAARWLPSTGWPTRRKGQEMPASLDSIRKEVPVEETPERVGLQITLTITAYDNGLVKVGKRPISQRLPGGDYETGSGWIGAAEYVTSCLAELQRRVVRRQAGDG
jgi:hypothetical protein